MSLPQLAGILECLSYPVLVLGEDDRITHINRAGEELFKVDPARVRGLTAAQALPEVFVNAPYLLQANFQRHLPSLGVWLEIRAYPSPCGLLVCAHDITEQKVHERILVAQKAILEMVAAHAPLTDILDRITALVSGQSPNDLCSILRLGKDGRRLFGAAVKDLPAEYNAAIEGVEIGPARGSCGTAAYTKQRVVVSDIATDPRWAGFADLATRHGLLACWSQPILSHDGSNSVLGTVANYYRRTGPPNARSLVLLGIASQLARIAIEEAESAEVLRRHSMAFQRTCNGVILTDAQGRVTDMNPAAQRMFGLPAPEAIGGHPSLLRDADGGEARQVATDILTAVERDGEWRGEVKFRHKDGHDGVSESVVVALNDPAGKMIAAVAVNHDVTERKRAEGQLAAEAAVARILARATTVADALPALLAAIGTTCDWDAGSIWILDPDARAIRCHHFWSSPDLRADEFKAATFDFAPAPGEGLPGRVWASAQAAWIADVSTDPAFPRRTAAAMTGLHSALAFPVVLDGRVVAVVEFFSKALRPFDAQLLGVFDVIGAQIAAFIHRHQDVGQTPHWSLVQ
jgi:PAS domain S-box-containing protein